MIEVRQASKVFYRGMQPVRALNDVSLTAATESSLAIQGPSGSGKTTLLTLIGTLDKPTSGAIRIAGTDPWAMSDRQRSQLRAESIGFVFQSYNLISQLPAWKNVALPLRYGGVGRRERKRRALAALDEVGLRDRTQHVPSQLSGGEEQRVATARAMVTSPKLLLADEPTGNLDTATGNQVIDQILSLHAAGATVIVVTHDEEIAGHFPRTIHLLDGAVIDSPGER